MKQPSNHDAHGKRDPSKIKCGGLEHQASSSERVEEVVSGLFLFLTGLEEKPELKSSLGAMSGKLVRRLRGGGWRRQLSTGVDSGAAATVLVSYQFQDYPLAPISLSRVNLGTRKLMG